MTVQPETPAPPAIPRLVALDVARGVAIAAMVVYHTAFDLSVNRLIPVDVVDDLAWTLFAHLIAGSFLLIVGISLVLATRSGFRAAPFLKRLGLIVAGAAAVSLATWWFEPDSFVYFGILHEIALASVLALAFLRLPSWLVVVAAAAVLAAPHFLASSFFDTPALWWVGLSTEVGPTVDYVPVFPWFGAVLLGIVAGRMVLRFAAPIGRWQPTARLARWTATAGRWSLAIYLVHQPLIVGLVMLAANVLPPDRAVEGANYRAECHAACTAEGGEAAYCTPLCACVFDGIWGTDLLAARAFSDEQLARFQGIVDQCRASPELGGGN